MKKSQGPVSSNIHHSPYESEIITVIVGAGDKARKFYIHKDFACNASPFFSGCLATKHFPEGRTNTVSLPEDDPEAFVVILAYMYNAGAKIPQEDCIILETWFLAYYLADKLGIKEAYIPLMKKVMSYCTSYLFLAAFPETVLDFPEYAVTKYLIAQVAWDFADSGYDFFCCCQREENATKCSWCEFITNGSPTVVRILAMLKDIKDEGIEPRKRGAEYWIDQAREQQAESDGKAPV